MQNFFKGKIGTIFIILATVVLAGVAVFTAVRLYQLRSQPVAPNVPSSIPKAAGVSGWCLDYSGNCVSYATATDASVACKPPITSCTSATPTLAPTTPPTSGVTTFYFYNTQTSSCQATTGHTNLSTCAANLSLTWPTKFGGTCYSSEPSCLDANPQAGNGTGGGGNGTSCSPRVYFNTVATDANGDNAGACKSTTPLTFDTNQIACDGSKQTCDQYLAALSISTGVTKVQGGCFADIASCQKPGGKTVSFRFFYDTVKKSCISTNHRYDSQDIDVDDVNHKTCLASLAQYQPNARQKCYTSKPSCISDNTIVIQPTPAPTAPPVVEHSNTCSLSFTISSVPTATPNTTAAPTPTPTNTSVSTTQVPIVATPTPPSLPNSGTDWPTVAGFGVGIFVILGSLLLAL